MSAKRKAVFLDRDGVLIVEKDYLSDPDEVELLGGVISGTRALQEAGFLLVVVSNQAGVARGFFSEEEVVLVNNRMSELMLAGGVQLDGIYYCPHHPEATAVAYRQNCSCRKPGPGMFLKAADELELNLGHSYMVGDKKSDLDAAAAAGVTGVLVLSGYGRKSLQELPEVFHAEEFTQAAAWIIADGESRNVR